MTFYVKTDEPTFTRDLKAELEKYGMKESNVFPVDIVFLSGKYAYYRNHVDLKKTLLSNTVTGDSLTRLTNKVELHRVFSDKNFILSSDLIPPIPRLPSSFLKILKPFGGFAGEGITIASTPDEVTQWMADHAKYSQWILQDYIQDPALKDGKKFHLRVYVIITLKPYRVYVCNQNPYFSAVKQYSKSDWKNTEIHDTHYNEGVQYYFPESLPDGWKTASNTDINLIVATVFAKERKFNPDWNAKNGYYMFGVDIMFDKKTPVLLEVNIKMGLKAANIIIPGMAAILLGKEQNDFIRVL
jgi:hypothetical protein